MKTPLSPIGIVAWVLLGWEASSVCLLPSHQFDVNVFLFAIGTMAALVWNGFSNT